MPADRLTFRQLPLVSGIMIGVGRKNAMTGWQPYQPPEDGLPPKEVRILELRGEPWAEDERRVRIHLETTPFLERPNIEVTITDMDGKEVSSIDIIESIESRMTFTMHIRADNAKGPFTLSANLAYPDIGIVDQNSVRYPQEK